MPCDVFQVNPHEGTHVFFSIITHVDFHSNNLISYHSLGIIVFNCFTFEEVASWELAMTIRGSCKFIKPILFLLHARKPQFDLASMSA